MGNIADSRGRRNPSSSIITFRLAETHTLLSATLRIKFLYFRNVRLLEALSGTLARKTFKAHSQKLFNVSWLQFTTMALHNLESTLQKPEGCDKSIYTFHNLRAHKLQERDLRPERSRFETLNRTDWRYVLVRLVVPNGRTAFDLYRSLIIRDI